LDERRFERPNELLGASVVAVVIAASSLCEWISIASSSVRIRIEVRDRFDSDKAEFNV
jgi:hypothetical protein